MKQDRTLRTTLITLEVAQDQTEKLIDFLYELKKEDETIESYCTLADYIYEAIATSKERLKTL